MPGRPRKPLQTLVMTGQFRADRHAERALEPQLDGVPAKPDGLDAVASAFWDSVVPQLVEAKILKQADEYAAATCCRLWSLLCRSIDAAAENPVDKELRSAVVAYHSAWDKAAGRIGLLPTERAKLSAGKPVLVGVSQFTRNKQAAG